jgi:hypothetical protein
MAVQAAYNFPKAFPGCTFEEVSFSIKRNTEKLDLTGAKIVLQVRENMNTDAILTLTSEAYGGIVITDAINGLFKVSKGTIPDTVRPFTYLYDIRFELSDGTIFPYIYGEWQIGELQSQID